MYLSEDGKLLEAVEENIARSLSKVNQTTSLSICFNLVEQAGQGPSFVVARL